MRIKLLQLKMKMNDILMFGGEHTNAYMSRIAEDPFYAEDE